MVKCTTLKDDDRDSIIPNTKLYVYERNHIVYGFFVALVQ